jgi:hypothetical protein
VEDYSHDKEEGLPKRSQFRGIGGKNRATAKDQQANTEEDVPQRANTEEDFPQRANTEEDFPQRANTEEDFPAVSGKKKGFV